MYQQQEQHIHEIEEMELQNHPTQDQRAQHHLTVLTQNPTISLKFDIKQVSFKALVPFIAPRLDKAKSLQLKSIYVQLLRNEVSKENFLRLMKGIVGDEIIKTALCKLEAQVGSSQLPHIPSSSPDIKVGSSDPMDDINSQISQAPLSQGINYSSNQFVTHWNNSSQDKLTNCQVKQDMSATLGNGLQNLRIQSQRVQIPHIQSQRVPNHQVFECRYQMPTQKLTNLQQTSNEQSMSIQNPENTPKNLKQVSFGQQFPVIVSELDMDKRMQLQTLYNRVRRNGASKEEFIWIMKETVDDQMIKKALYKHQTQAEAQAGSSQLPRSSSCHRKLINSDADLSRHIPSSTPEIQVESSDAIADINEQTFQAHLSQGSNYASSQSVTCWHCSSQDKLINRQVQQDMNKYQQQEPHMSAMVENRLQNLSSQSLRVHNPPLQSQRVPNRQVAESQYAIMTQNPANLQQTSKNRKRVSLVQLILLVVRQLDKDKSTQLHTLFIKWRRNEISKQGFLRLMNEIAGDHIITMALYKLQTQAGSSQLHRASLFRRKLINSHADLSRHIHSSAPEMLVSSDAISGINGQTSHDHLSQRCNRAKLQQISNQQTLSTPNPAHTSKTGKQVSFGQLIYVIVPHLDKNKRMQMLTLFGKLKRNKVPKEGFLRLMKEIVGDQMIKMALYKLQTQAKTQAGSSKLPQLINSQQTMSIQKAENASNRKQVRIGQLIRVMESHLDVDKLIQLQTLYVKLRRNEVPKEGVYRLIKEIVGDQMFETALYKLQTQAADNSQTGPSQLPNFCSSARPQLPLASL